MSSDSRLHGLGLIVTVAIHVGLIGGVYAMNELSGAGGSSLKKADELPSIEAGLAIKQKKAKGTDSKQPQKTVSKRKKIADIGVTRKEKPEVKKPEEEKDPGSWKEELHKPKADEEETPAEPPPATGAEDGKDDENKDGKADGSEKGTKLNASGDPYEAELSDRLSSHFEAADFPRAQGLLKVKGCFSLNADGTLKANWELAQAGDTTPDFNSAVDRAFRETAKELEAVLAEGKLAAVPDHLVEGLVKGKKCIVFHN